MTRSSGRQERSLGGVSDGVLAGYADAPG